MRQHTRAHRPAASCRRTAFTLIEMLIVMGVIGLLAGLLVVGIWKVRLNVADKVTGALIAGISQALEQYKGDFHVYPPDDCSQGWTNGERPTNPAECLAFFLTREFNKQSDVITPGGKYIYEASIDREPYLKDLHEDMVLDVDNNGWPELLDGHMLPFVYNRGQFLANRVGGTADADNRPSSQTYPLHNKQSYDLFSVGRDGLSNTVDVRGRLQNGEAFRNFCDSLMDDSADGEGDDDVNNWSQ